MPLVGSKIELTSDDFGHRVRKDYLLVDKTLMIKEFIEGQDVALITCPRRFGKTLNMSMLYYFFCIGGGRTADKGFVQGFCDCQGSGCKGCKVYGYTSRSIPGDMYYFYSCAFKKIKSLIQELYDVHQDCLKSDRLSEMDKAKFHKYLGFSSFSEPDEVDLGEALYCLSKFLYKVYSKKVIILIDEYDSPLTSAYEHGYLEALSDFMRALFSSALKTNRYLKVVCYRV